MFFFFFLLNSILDEVWSEGEIWNYKNIKPLKFYKLYVFLEIFEKCFDKFLILVLFVFLIFKITIFDNLKIYCKIIDKLIKIY